MAKKQGGAHCRGVRLPSHAWPQFWRFMPFKVEYIPMTIPVPGLTSPGPCAKAFRDLSDLAVTLLREIRMGRACLYGGRPMSDVERQRRCRERKRALRDEEYDRAHPPKPALPATRVQPPQPPPLGWRPPVFDIEALIG
jgi:hypothetical protein